MSTRRRRSHYETDAYLRREKCFFCDSNFAYGPHAYHGEFLKAHQILLCDGCLRGTWGGIGPAFEAKLLRHLEEHNLPVPARNSKGLLVLSR